MPSTSLYAWTRKTNRKIRQKNLQFFWDDSENNNTFARIFNLTDEKGNFTMTEPGLLSELNKKEKGFKAYQDFKARHWRGENDPWIKKAFCN